MRTAAYRSSACPGLVNTRNRRWRSRELPGRSRYKFAEIQPATGFREYEQKFAKLLEERTQGRVKVTVFAGGALGGEKDVLEACASARCTSA